MECVYCSKICKNENSKRNHQRLCKLNPEKQVSSFTKYNRELATGEKSKRYGNQYTKAVAEGLPQPTLSNETRKKLSINAKLRNANESEEAKQKRIQTITKHIAEGKWHSGGRSKRVFKFDIWFDSPWEAAYATYLTERNISWIRNKEFFLYVNSKTGKTHRYFPDFYLPESDTFVEIKGRVTPKDFDKWEHFPKNKNLRILKCQELRKLGII